MSGYLRPTAPIFDDVLLPADPGVALALAQKLLVKPMMSNHAFGLWGYSGVTDIGHELTIQAAGIGGPSAATVLTELAGLGTRHAIAMAGCSALDPGLNDEACVIAESARDIFGAVAKSSALLHPDLDLSAALAAASPNSPAVTVASTYMPGANRSRLTEQGAAVADLASAALFATASRLGVRVAIGLTVAGSGENDEPHPGHVQLELGAAAASALAAI